MVVTLDDVRLHCTETEGRLPLIALHGGMGIDGGTLRVAPILRLADEGIRVIIPDQRGHGASSGRETRLTHSVWADDVRRMADALCLPRFALLGHSYGGFLALEFAARWADRLSHLILVGTSAGPRPGKASPVSDDDAVKALFRSRWPIFFSGADQHWDLFESLGFSAAGYNAAFVDELPKYDLREQIAQISTPTLLVTGEHDWYLPDMHWLASHVPHSRLEVIPGAGHFVFLEQPARFTQVVGEFLRQTTSMASP